MRLSVAVMVVVPNAKDVTGTLTVLVPAGIVTLTGTEATDGLLEMRFTVSPAAGVGAERLSAKFCVLNPLIVTDYDAKVMTAPTLTAALAAVYPDASAVMLAVP